MATTTKFTITLDNAQFEEIKRMVGTGETASVSAFVKKAIETALNDADDWDRTLDDMLEKTGGPITAAERKWLDAVRSGRPARRPKSLRRRS